MRKTSTVSSLLSKHLCELSWCDRFFVLSKLLQIMHQSLTVDRSNPSKQRGWSLATDFISSRLAYPSLSLLVVCIFSTELRLLGTSCFSSSSFSTSCSLRKAGTNRQTDHAMLVKVACHFNEETGMGDLETQGTYRSCSDLTETCSMKLKFGVWSWDI